MRDVVFPSAIKAELFQFHTRGMVNIDGAAVTGVFLQKQNYQANN